MAEQARQDAPGSVVDRRSGPPREIDTIALASARRSMVGSYEWRSPSVKMRIMCSLKCRSSPRTG